MIKKSWLVIVLMLFFINIKASADQVSAGPWRFVLKTAQTDIPFIINFEYNNNKLTGLLKNGMETIPLGEISYLDGKLSIPFPIYELSLELSLHDAKSMSGYLVRHNKNPVIKTPVSGSFGQKELFNVKKVGPTVDLNGKWALKLEDEKNQKSPGIGNFVQTGGHLSGSILTSTGDYRYLDGYVSGDQFEAASFDGVYNYVFKGSIKDGVMSAAILSNSKTKITGQLDSNAELPDAYKQTEINELKFILPDLKGQSVTLNHPKFKNKPVVVQIFGSWCPNCMDELNYLIPWYKSNARRGVEVIALAFERSLNVEEATRQLLKVQKKLNVPYTILQAGSTAEEKPMDKLPGLKNFISFPTTIFLNKKHQVVKVHAGFSGPSTGAYYEKWKAEFNQTINELLKK
jgi:thiol-disulfide isomerase/thioredoxin